MANCKQKKRVSDIISNADIKHWKPNNIIIISAGTGSGKSYFIKNNLYKYAKSNHKRILFLIHRSNCAIQFQEEIRRDGKEGIIEIMTYQKIEYDIINAAEMMDFSKYAYIVCDEFHYFISDANFNNTTDISFTEIMHQKNCVKIFMSATGEDVESYFAEHYRKRIIKYELKPDYSYVTKLTFFFRDDDIELLAKKIISQNQKALIFIQSAQKAYKLFKKFKSNSLFLCSKTNSHYKYVDKGKIKSMLQNECFDENLLITTSCLDAGANIIDRAVKYIIADITDIGSLIQCLGRKRCQGVDDTCSFYIKTITNQQLSGLHRSACKDIEMADYLLKHNTQELILQYPRQSDKSRIIYDDTNFNKQKNMSTKKVNKMMFAKKKADIKLYSELMSVEYGYCKHLAKWLGFQNANGYYTYDVFAKDYSLIAFLNEYAIDKIVMLQAKDRKPLINQLNIRSKSRHQLKSLDSLNAALIEMNLPYHIISFSTHRMINGKNKQFKKAWRIEKTGCNVVNKTDSEKRCKK